MLNFEKIKGYFKDNLWSIDQVKNAVNKDKITELEFIEIAKLGVELGKMTVEQFKDITGVDYISAQ